MSSIQELRNEAYKVIHETQEGGNSASRIGNLYNGIIDFLGVLDERTVDPYYYDDTALKDAIRRVNAAIDELDRELEAALILARQEKQRLDDLVNTIDSEINEKVEDMLNDAQWLEAHAQGIQEAVNAGEILWKDEWDNNVEAYIKEVGLWYWTGDDIKTQWTEVVQSVSEITSTVAEVQQDLAGRPTSTQWTQISQKVNGIEQTVNKLLYQPGSLEALQSSITQSIDDKVARLNLETTYAKAEDFGNSTKVIEWMYSAFRNETGPDKTFNEIVSAEKSGFDSAVADIRTYVEEVKNGDVLQHVSITSMEASVNDAITGLYNEALAGEARSLMFSQVANNTNNIATIVTHATGDYSEADIATKFDEFRGGLITRTNADEAVSSLLAAGEGSKSGIVVRAALDEATTDILSQVGDMTSGFLLTAKLGEATAQMVAQDRDSGATAAIVAKVNRSGSEIMLSADQITMTNAFANKITANEAFIGYLKGGEAEFSGKITALSGKIGGFTIDENGNISGENAKFTGIIYATDGEFTGKVTATEGYIGSFKIDRNSLGTKPTESGGPWVYLMEGGYFSVNRQNSAYSYAADIYGGARICAGTGINASSSGNRIIVNGDSVKIYGGIVNIGEQYSNDNVNLHGFVQVNGYPPVTRTMIYAHGQQALPNLNNVEDGHMVFCKSDNGNDLILTGVIMFADSRSTGTSLNIGDKSMIFVKMGGISTGYWVQFYCG